MTRFSAASDPVEWELFRTEILRSQGWDLQRVWAPAVFRDLVSVRQGVEERVRGAVDFTTEAQRAQREGEVSGEGAEAARREGDE